MTRRPAPDHPRRGPGNPGSAAAEFAIVVPVLILLLFTIVTLSSVFFDQLHLQSAARDGARAGALDVADACPTADTALAANDIGDLDCTVPLDCSTGSVQVRLVATRDYTIPLLGVRSVELSATSSFRCPG